jgi:hypothetical protein
VQFPQLSLCAAVKKKQLNVPVFLIYAGIIHAIGLALLLPIMITLPGGSKTAPETSVIDIEVVPANSAAAIIGHDDEETAALPAAAAAPGDGAKSEEDAGAVAIVAPEAQAPEADAVAAAKDDAAAEAAKPARPAAHAPAKKTAARSHTARPSVRRAKASTKIAPFNGLSGLFAPGAPANKRR